jgi:hypothetical protein
MSSMKQVTRLLPVLQFRTSDLQLRSGLGEGASVQGMNWGCVGVGKGGRGDQEC